MYQLLKMGFNKELDLIQACRCGRQIAALVGLNDQAQLRLSTAISDYARSALNPNEKNHIEFTIVNNDDNTQSLTATIQDNKANITALPTFTIHLPANVSLTPQLWQEIVNKVSRNSPKDLIEEIHRHNQELLDALTKLQHHKKELHQVNKELAETNRGVIALTAELEQKAEHLQYLSLHDKMTGLYNRAYFEEEINRLEGGRKYPVSIIVFDVDNLKLINDSLGHKTGDEILIKCADLLKRTIRNEDVLARIGGDEFVLILPATGAEKAVQVMARIKTAIKEYNCINTKHSLKVSMGCATSTGRQNSLTETFKIADTNMYKEKLSHNTSRGTIVSTLMMTLAERDFITSGHSERLCELAKAMGTIIDLPIDKTNDLILLSQVHDIGKIGIPDSILFKTGQLNREEWKVMKRHPEIGHKIAKASADLRHIADLILLHHEHWDGQGYPYGLKGNSIPVECRILAIIDAFDAMTNDRPYKKRISKDDAITEIKACAGSQFDPELAEKFISVLQVSHASLQNYG